MKMVTSLDISGRRRLYRYVPVDAERNSAHQAAEEYLWEMGSEGQCQSQRAKMENSLTGPEDNERMNTDPEGKIAVSGVIS